jgi:hypothetical protein
MVIYIDYTSHLGFGVILELLRGHQSNSLTGLMATFSDHADPSFIPLTLHN